MFFYPFSKLSTGEKEVIWHDNHYRRATQHDWKDIPLAEERGECHNAKQERPEQVKRYLSMGSAGVVYNPLQAFLSLASIL